MSDLTAKFGALEAQLADQQSALLAALSAAQSALDFINTQLDTQTINNATNTRALLAAMGQTGACFPCPTPSIIVPPVDTVVNPANEDRCKRAQAFVATIHNILAAMDTMQSFNVIGTFNVLNDAISEVIAAVAAGDTVPLPSFPETVNIVGDYVSYAGERIFSGVGLIEQFSPLESALISALASTSTTESAQSAYNAVFDASSVSLAGKLLFKAVAYSALYNYFFDPATLPDLSSYSGTACTLLGCVTQSSVNTTLPPRGGTKELANVIGPVIGFSAADTITFTGFPPYIWDADVIWVGDAFGWTFNWQSGGPFDIDAVDSSNVSVFHTTLAFETPVFTWSVHTARVMVAVNLIDTSPNPSFSMEACPPTS